MADLTEQQRDMLKLFAYGDKPAEIARMYGLDRISVVDELTQLCELNPDVARTLLAAAVQVEGEHGPEPRELAKGGIVRRPGFVEPDPAEVFAETVVATVQVPDVVRPLLKEALTSAHREQNTSYVDYRAYRCTDCGRTGPGSCQPGHASEPITIRIFDSVVL